MDTMQKLMQNALLYRMEFNVRPKASQVLLEMEIIGLKAYIPPM